jgi:hypothetical protein
MTSRAGKARKIQSTTGLFGMSRRTSYGRTTASLHWRGEENRPRIARIDP